jgi:hypothetical protein
MAIRDDYAAEWGMVKPLRAYEAEEHAYAFLSAVQWHPLSIDVAVHRLAHRFLEWYDAGRRRPREHEGEQGPRR